MSEPLPIARYRQEIVHAVQTHQVVIVRAETGAGKSTQVPQFLLGSTGKIIVTQPRRLAAIGIAERVAKEMKLELGNLVGYRTAMDRKDSSETRLLFITDGLEVMHEVLGAELPQGILVIDEVHEWNLNIETLVAWTHFQLQRGAPYKLVIMSATIDPKPLLSYFGETGIVEVPGKTFPVTKKRTSGKLIRDVVSLLERGRNVLVFQPGKKEIKDTILELAELQVDAELLPLHAGMSYADQARCFEIFGRPKCVVATNVAQTSITIPDIDAVVDSGLERRIEYINGVEGLYIRPISLADRTQRKGRAGRTRPGIFVDACLKENKVRLEYPQPEILRLPVDKVLLQLAHVGIEIDELKFFHELPEEKVKTAREMLFNLGCVDRWGALTQIGKRVAVLPTGTRWGRILVEAEDRGVLTQVIILVSVMEQGRLTTGKSNKWKKDTWISSWSDAFVQLAAYKVAMNLLPHRFEEMGIDPHAFICARDMCHRLSTRLKKPALGNSPNGRREKEIVCCLYAGLADCLYKKSLVRGYKDKSGDVRDLPPQTVVGNSDWVIGLPWNLQVESDLGPKTRRIITMATRVDQALFEQVAPHLAIVKK